MNSVTPTPNSCGAEPIHIPGAIQEHGALLVLSARELTALQASDNLRDYIDASIPIGVVPSREILPFIDALPAWYSGDESGFRYVWAQKKLHVSGHRLGNTIILEVERTGERDSADALMSELIGLAQYLNSAASLEDALLRTAQLVSSITGYDRTLIYDWTPRFTAFSIADGTI